MAVIDKIIVKENSIEHKVDSIDNKTIDLLRYYPGKVLNMSIKGNSSQSGTPTSSSPIEIQSVGKLGKNLCGDRNVLIDQLIGNSTNGVIVDSTVYNTMFIEVEEGQTYSFTGFVRADGSSLKGCFYDSNKEWVSAFEETTVTIPTGVRYIGRSFNNTIEQVQFELGEPTEYEPYGYRIPIIVDGKKIEIKVNEPLRKIGTYADTLDYANKRIIRKIASEFITNVQTMSSETSTYKKFLTDITYKPLVTTVSSSYLGYAISNKFKQSTLVYSQMGTTPNLIQSYITTGGVSRCVYTFDDASVQTVAAAQPLIGDGFEVCYVMADTIEETIEVPEIKAGKNTKFEFDTLEPSSFSITAFEDYEVSLA